MGATATLALILLKWQQNHTAVIDINKLEIKNPELRQESITTKQQVSEI